MIEVLPLKSNEKKKKFILKEVIMTFFKSKKAKSMISSILDEVEGLGPTRKKRLLTLYHSIDEIKKASVEQLSQILPKNVAINLLNVLQDK